ncbi:MAG: response regulator [Verrucomicrobiota bacterium]
MRTKSRHRPRPGKGRRPGDHSSHAAAFRSGRKPLPPTPLRIFIVEDHPDTRKWLGVWLEDLGHTVVSAATCSEALEKFPRAQCTVLLCDIGLPDGTGWDLILHLQQTHAICAIAMSGFGRESDWAKSKEKGYRYHVIKPLDPDVLETILEEIAQGPSSRAACP